MAFDGSVITEVYPPREDAGVLYLSWTSSAPSGTWYQIYIGRRLAHWTQDLRAAIPWGDVGRRRIEIGAVASAAEARTDLSAYLPAPLVDRVELSWQGGTFQSADIAGFRVYGEASPGSGIDYTRPLATVAAYDQGIVTDGFGLGGFGDGGFGAASGDYTFVSGQLAAGTSSFAVAAVDQAGNEGVRTIVSQAIAAPPLPPARDVGGSRLNRAYHAGAPSLLRWLASPSTATPPPSPPPPVTTAFADILGII